MIVTEGDTITHSRLITASSGDGRLEIAVRAPEHKVLTSNMLEATLVPALVTS